MKDQGEPPSRGGRHRGGGGAESCREPMDVDSKDSLFSISVFPHETLLSMDSSPKETLASMDLAPNATLLSMDLVSNDSLL